MKIRRWLTALVAAALSVALAGQLWAFAADAVFDLTQKCTLKVNPCDAQANPDMAADLADVVVDLYKVAEWDTAGDSYGFKAVDPFMIPQMDPATNEGWAQAAQWASQTALQPVREPYKKAVPAGTEAQVEPGLYLLVAHGKDDEDYVKTVTDDTGRSHLVTQVRAGRYLYTFAPELISVPTKQPENGQVNTANPGGWVYDVAVNLKPQREEFKGQLEIVKRLLTYETSGPATFVFQLEWEADGQKHSEVRSLTFTAAGEQSLLVEGLPVGVEVTVTEVYSGASYKLVTEGSQTVVIQADETARVEFVNDYSESGNSGGAVVNKFTFDGEEWQWTQQGGLITE